MISLKQASLCVLTLISVPCLASANESAECLKVNIGDGGWTDNQAQNGFAAVVLRKLGYKPVTTLLSIGVMMQGMKRGDVDVFMGQWSPNGDAVSQPYLDSGVLRKISTNLTGAKYSLAVPAYTYAEGLQTVQDIARWKDKLGGKIYALEPGNDSNIVLEKIRQEGSLGLKDFNIVASSEHAMLSAVDKAVKAKRPIVFIGWAPHPMNTKFDMKYLSGGDQWFGPNYGSATVWTGMRPAYADKCPNVTNFFQNLVFTTDLLGGAMTKIAEGTPADQVAEAYLKANPAVLDNWLEGVKTASGGDGLSTVQAALK